MKQKEYCQCNFNNAKIIDCDKLDPVIICAKCHKEINVKERSKRNEW